MTGKGHTLVGLISTLGLYQFTKNEVSSELIYHAIGTVAFILGATAPDWMEFRKSSGGTLITHRTWTHWLLPWIAIFLITGSQEPINLISYDFLNEYNIGLSEKLNFALFCFSLGGLLHLSVDIPNPMGIPILTPFHRFSLKLWKSGKYETAICFVFLGINLIYCDYIKLNI